MRPRSIQPPCPDCGGAAVKNGQRRGTTINRYTCVNTGGDPECNRRFTDNTKDTPRSGRAAAPVTPSKDALRADTHVYIFTWGQNATPVHRGFWLALGAMVEHRSADLNVIRGRYRNPTIRGTEDHEDEWWAKEIVPHLWDKRTDICPTMTVLGDIRVQPTAQRPLTGLDSITSGKSGLIGHPKMELRFIPTPQNELPKQMQTTGACTVENYSDSKAGKKGEFHHTIGAIIVEVRGDKFHMRQLNAAHNGSFIDLDTEYLNDGTRRPAKRALALSMGDWHSGMTSLGVIDATFGLFESTVSICEVLKPKALIWDDTLDQYARNHHHRDNPFIAHAKHHDRLYGRNDLYVEVQGALYDVGHYTSEAKRRAGGPVRSYVKSSNHDDALTRYIVERNWKNDPENMEFYLDTARMMLDATKMTEAGAAVPSAFALWGKKELKGQPVTFVGRGDPLMIADISCTFHGDIGPNGARGSINAFSKIGVKTIIGHSHTPGIVGGCYQVGTSTHLNLEYNKGPSSWSNTHCVVYANGKRALITIIDGQWRH